MNMEHHDPTRLSADDLYLFNEGTHRTLATKLGAHFRAGEGTSFAVWAPNARSVSVMGDFNYWNPTNLPLSPPRFLGDLGGRRARGCARQRL
jgi:1,4-alpha-glucan branching enzyme